MKRSRVNRAVSPADPAGKSCMCETAPSWGGRCCGRRGLQETRGSAQPHTTIPCYKITAGDTLEAGDGTHTDQYSFTCAGNCSSGRNYLSTRNWVYKISNAGNGTCSANAGSSYDLWNVVWGINTEIWLPDTKEGYELRFGGPNDAPNESSGHYFICP